MESADEPSLDEPSLDEPSLDEPSLDEPSLDELREAVDDLDPTDEEWVDLLWLVADGLHERFLEETLDPTDLDEAIARGTRVVRAQGENSAEHLMDLSVMLWTRIEAHPTPSDVAEYIRLNERALDLVGQSRERADLLPACQANLATGLMSRNRFEPATADRARAIALWEAALESPTLDEDVRAGIHSNLAQALTSRSAPVAQLRAGVEHGREALRRPVDDDEAVGHLHFGLANALSSLAERSEEAGLVAEAIGHIREGLALIGREHPDYAGFSVNLVSALRVRSRQTGDPMYLDEAECIVREVILPGIPAGHHDRVMALTESASIINELAYWRDADWMHREAIEMYLEAVEAAPPASHEQGVALVNLAAASRDASDRLNDGGIIDSGISAGEEALTIFTEPDLYRASALTATSNLLRDRFVARGQISDLDNALELSQTALELTPADHQEYAARQTNLAVLLSDDFAERANLARLDQAIGLYRDALAFAEPVARRISERHNDLGLALRDRYRDSQSPVDLDEAIEHASDSVLATPRDAVAWAGYANNYGNALADRYELTDDLEDLERAIQLFREVQIQGNDRSGEASGYATNLGLALASLAVRTKRESDFDEALSSLNRSVELLPPGHPDLASRLSNLADVQRQRSQAELDSGRQDAAARWASSAVTTAARAVAAAGSSDSRLLPALANQARAMRLLHRLDPGSIAIDEVLKVQRRAALLNEISPSERFGQAALWARDAHQAGDRDQELAAYRQAVGLTSEVAWIGLTEVERLNLLAMMSEVLVAAVSLAVESGHVWLALAWADQIRAVLARQNTLAKGLAKGLAKFDRAGGERMAASLVPSAAMPGDGAEGGLGYRERRRTVAHQHAGSLALRTPGPDDYQSLRFPGFIVLLVPGTDAAAAVIIDGATGADRIVKLPRASEEALAEQVERFQAACQLFQEPPGEVMLVNETRAQHRTFDSLEWLWEAVAEPILRELPTTPARTRVWWSPIGDFALLPLHAAGRHPRKAAFWTTAPRLTQESVAAQVISSYLPTIWPVRAAQHVAPGEAEQAAALDPFQHRLLYVGTDTSQGSLPQAAAERAAISNALTQLAVDELTDAEATPSAIREGINRSSFLHVSAHGTTSDGDSFRSGFRLLNGTFTVSDLAECDAPNGRLAVFLSCDAAAGDTQSPNEALHLAGAAQQAGFPDVIAATMPLRDAATVSAVGPVYEAVDRDPDGIAGRVAEVLADAVDHLRRDIDTGPDPLAWAPYAHFGWGLHEPPSRAVESSKRP